MITSTRHFMKPAVAVAARILANELQPRLGTPVIVENLVGAGGRLAMQQIQRMPADTNVVVLANPALMVVAPFVYKCNGYDADADFQALSQVSSYELGVAVAAAVPVREFSHLIAWTKANLEKANLGVPATGILPHFFALMVAKAASTPKSLVGDRGSVPLAIDLMDGHIPVAVDTLDSLLPLHQSGKLKILATTGDIPVVPGVPTLKSVGFDAVETSHSGVRFEV